MWTSAPLAARNVTIAASMSPIALIAGSIRLRTHGLNLDDVAGEVAGHVEVVDGHVAEEAARDLDVLDRRRRRIAAGDHDLLELADLAGLDAGRAAP